MPKQHIPPENFVFFNPNPSWTGKGRYRHQDCPIRAICAAEWINWEQAYDLLYISGREVFDAPTSDDSISCCLTKLGYVKSSLKIKKGQKRPTVLSFAEEHPEGVYVLRVANHITTVIDGHYYDCWDCGNMCVYSVYEKNPF